MALNHINHFQAESSPPFPHKTDEPVEHCEIPTLRKKRVNAGSKKEALLAANRRSGQKCRYRKMIILEELQESVSKLSKQQAELLQQNAILKKELIIVQQAEEKEKLEMQFLPPPNFPIDTTAISLPEVEEPHPNYNENLQQIHTFIKQIQKQQATSILPVFPPLHILHTHAPHSLVMKTYDGIQRNELINYECFLSHETSS